MSDRSSHRQNASQQERQDRQERRDWEHRLTVNIRDNQIRQQEVAQGPIPVPGASRDAQGQTSTGMDPAAEDPHHASSYSTEEGQAERDRQQRFFAEEAERARVRQQVATLADRIGPYHEVGRLEANWRATLGPTHRRQDRQEETCLGLNPQAQPFQPSQQARSPLPVGQQHVEPASTPGPHWGSSPPGGMPMTGSAQTRTGSLQPSVQGDESRQGRGASEGSQQRGLSGQYTGPDNAQQGDRHNQPPGNRGA